MDPFKERPKKQEMQLVLEQSSSKKDEKKRVWLRVGARLGHFVLSVFVVMGISLNKNSSLYGAVTTGSTTVELVLFPILIVASFCFYFTASLMDPGYVPLTSEGHEDTTTLIKSDRAYFCRWCDQAQPLRSKHCRDCDRCVRRFDHHCPWLGNCVGEKNHRFFLFFLLAEDLLIFLCIGMTWDTSRSSDEVLQWVQYNGILLICGIILFFGGLAVTALLCCHLYLVLHGVTTWEHVSHSKITYLRRWPDDSTPFNLGYCRNCLIFCCYCNVQNWEKYIKSLT